ncbi:MAG: hypothetical protein RLO46_02970 [Pseudomonadales bacterium]
MRIPYGPGYRVYFMRSGAEECLILMGGTKGSQRSDIREAMMIANALAGGRDE